jgi:hypothetical protein
MKELDELIRATLSAEDAAWFDEWDEQSLTEKVVQSFRGKSRGLVLLVYIAVTVFFGLMVLAMYRLWTSDSTRDMILWATAFMFFCLATTMLKLWYWMELNRNTVLREIKRVELQLARITHRPQNHS